MIFYIYCEILNENVMVVVISIFFDDGYDFDLDHGLQDYNDIYLFVIVTEKKTCLEMEDYHHHHSHLYHLLI